MKTIDLELVNSIFEYRDGMLWHRRLNREAGGIDAKGYRNIYIEGELYKAHRLIWAIHYGDPGASQVDHKDHDRLNNQIENLRLADSQGNNRNRSGVRGFCWSKRGQHWVATICIDGTDIYLRATRCMLEARAEYLRARRRYFGEFA